MEMKLNRKTVKKNEKSVEPLKKGTSLKSSLNSNVKIESMPQPLPLTEKEKKVLEFIVSQLAQTGLSPSYQEIKDHFGFASYNSVQNYLKQLMNKGYIQVNPHQKRAIQIIQDSSAVQNWIHNSSKESPRSTLLHTPGDSGEILSIPLLGKVAAGSPIESYKHNEYIEVPPSLVKNFQKTFALQVQGNSMIEEGIFDGDIILIQKQESAKNGEIIVATVDNESTVKRIFYSNIKKSGTNFKNKNSDYSDQASAYKSVELRPANSEMKSMWYSADQIQIQGLVTGLIRKFNQ